VLDCRVYAGWGRCGAGDGGEQAVKIQIVVHEAEEGGYWAEVPAIPGCATQGETFEELLQNLYEAIEGCLSVQVDTPKETGRDRVLEISV
jgi:predicted RNase H-like HicB family nuclease